MENDDDIVAGEVVVVKRLRSYELTDTLRDKVEDLLAEGWSQTAVRAKIGVTNHLWNIWLEDRPDFRLAVELGVEKGRMYFEDIGRRGMNMSGKDFNFQVWNSYATNIMGWNTSSTKSTVEQTNVTTTTQIDLSLIPSEQLNLIAQGLRSALPKPKE